MDWDDADWIGLGEDMNQAEISHELGIEASGFIKS
jgi:hypothetical protein